MTDQPAPPRARVEVSKDRFTEGYHVFLDGRAILGSTGEHCIEVGELLMLGIQAKLEGASINVKVK